MVILRRAGLSPVLAWDGSCADSEISSATDRRPVFGVSEAPTLQRFNSILFVTESSVAQQSALARAVSLAENHQASLTVIDVVPSLTTGIGTSQVGPGAKDLKRTILQDSREKLESEFKPYAKGVDIRLDVVEGKKSLEVIRNVLRNRHDLLIKPAENPSYTQRLFGSDDMQLLRNCPCPVWLTREDEKSKYNTILAAVDFELDLPDKADLNLNDQIAELSSSIAVSDFAALHFIHVWDALAEATVRRWSTNPDEAAGAYVNGTRSSHDKLFREFHERFRARIGKEADDHLDPQFLLRRGTPANTISATANELQADLLVMGTVARTGIAGWLIGNTAEAVLEQVRCSVLAIKPHGFVSPVTLV